MNTLVRKQTITPFANSALNTDAIDVTNHSNLSYQFNLTGSGIAGSIQIQKSNDGTNWTNEGSAIVIAGPATHVVALPSYCYASVRAVITSSDADLIGGTIYFVGKEH